MTGPWEDSDLINYKRALRKDPCTYCGGEGGTVDHVVPRPDGGKRWDWENWTGACEDCNRKKDMGKDGGHRKLLDFIVTRRENRRSAERITLRSSLQPGDVVYSPWGDEGRVTRVEERSIFVWIAAQSREWRCGNSASLRDAYGNRLVSSTLRSSPS